ncbi:MAG: bifunctional phosphoglucose/phosphomannose isomerase [Candidatus Neomarinimicrobiota bacterium]
MAENKIDTENMYQAIYDFPDHMVKAAEIGNKINLKRKYSQIRSILVIGMGGSAIGGDIVRALTKNELKVPLKVLRHYCIPAWVNSDTLIICSSYSGNTEESLSAYKAAAKRSKMIVGISTGGQLSNEMKAQGHDIILIPPGYQPRAALALNFIPLLYLLHHLELIGILILSEISGAVDILLKARKNYSLHSVSNPALELAQKIYQRLPLIYGETEGTGLIAVRWKGQFNENAKMLAFNNDLPEMNHNEIVGWENNTDILGNISILWLTDKKDHKRTKLRQKITREIIGDLAGDHEIISVDGDNTTERFVHLIHFGDWVSYWCALLHETNPTPVTKIDRLKIILSDAGK